mmetsp:Transcript_49460/g.81383  ORF Transcript_49460/g.81383 Transcript_49460/m.81383 type:complete len:89 (+) Transcript_49460:301-567(+)
MRSGSVHRSDMSRGGDCALIICPQIATLETGGLTPFYLGVWVCPDTPLRAALACPDGGHMLPPLPGSEKWVFDLEGWKVPGGRKKVSG